MAFTVIVVWVASVVYGMFARDFTPFAATTPVVVIVCGYTFGVGTIVRSAEKGERKNGD